MCDVKDSEFIQIVKVQSVECQTQSVDEKKTLTVSENESADENVTLTVSRKTECG